MPRATASLLSLASVHPRLAARAQNDSSVSKKEFLKTMKTVFVGDLVSEMYIYHRTAGGDGAAAAQAAEEAVTQWDEVIRPAVFDPAPSVNVDDVSAPPALQ